MVSAAQGYFALHFGGKKTPRFYLRIFISVFFLESPRGIEEEKKK